MCSVAVRLTLVELKKEKEKKRDQQLNHYSIFVCVHEICAHVKAQLGTKGTCMSNKTIMGLCLVS